MDVFVEQIVKKKFGPLDYVIFAGVVLAGLVLTALAFVFLPPFAVIVFAGVCFGAYYLITSRSLEFEYSVTNGDITIDKIIYRRSRRRVISLDANTVEEMGKYDPEKHRAKSYASRLFTSRLPSGEGAWYFTARHPKFGYVLVVFDPDEQVLEAIRPFLTRQVAKDAFGRY